MATKIKKPFTTKGFTTVTPKGEALWCKATEPDFQFNAKGTYETSLVVDPNDPAVEAFINKLDDVLEGIYQQAMNDEGELKLKAPQKKQLSKNNYYKDEYDSDDNETGNIIFKFKLDNVADRKPGQDRVKVIDSQLKALQDIPLVGNGSEIKCKLYVNPYYMASTNSVGLSLKWEALQIINLVEYGGDDGFDVEDGGFTSSPSDDFGVEDTGNDEEDF